MSDPLQEWPEARREALLWRFALTLDYEGVADYVRTTASSPCFGPHWQARTGELTAVLGDDGRYHLLRGDLVLCSGISERGSRALPRHADGPVRHQRRYDWWTDGTTYRMFAPPTAPIAVRRGPRHYRVVEWAVQCDSERVAPGTVLPSQRCTYVGGRSDWPPSLSPDSRIGRIRQRLIDLAGAQCHACGLQVGVIVDHDPFTGLIRGLLCSDCNAWIDICPHLRGCPRAAYLNNPPARHLQLRYPHAHRDRDQHRARIDYLGIDPLPPTRPYRRR
ncbi:endonuclease domain-containing protein [Amycolatopsis sp. NPDC051128]|uniref:endonuclease domain-containing protein n=1 Tax=Amycolatopsis sp. NPDC051128 TaxID=3155412 RepID=UPI003440F921